MNRLIKKLEKNCGIELTYLNTNTMEDLIESVETAINEQMEVIYYLEAMKYLAENDPSLLESIQIAREYGITDINSEFLATIHLQKKTRDKAYEIINDYKEL